VSNEREEAAVKATAGMITADDAFAGEKGIVPPDEVIAEPNPADYLSPSYLKSTAPHLAAEFGELLEKLRDLNARFVGRRTVEVQAYFSLTGEHELLETAFYEWCKKYFAIRGDLGRLSPRNENDPWVLYVDCYKKEFHPLLELLLNKPGTVNSSVLNLSQSYMQTEFAASVLSGDLQNALAFRPHRFKSEWRQNTAHERVGDYNAQRINFAEFFHAIKPHVAPVANAEGLARLELETEQFGRDLAFLRTILSALNVPPAQTQPLTPDIWATLHWDVYHGGTIAALLTSDTAQVENDRRTKHAISLRRDGWLCHRECPWIRIGPDSAPDARPALWAVNHYVVGKLIDPLLQAWSLLEADPEPVISRGLSDSATEEEQIAAVAVALATAEVDEEAAAEEQVESDMLPSTVRGLKGYRPPAMRLRRFRKILEKHFDCEWSNVGGDAKVFRVGGRNYIIGDHGSKAEVSWPKMKDCLDRLGIAREEFIAVCRKRSG
jgi:hypothetical protein